MQASAADDPFDLERFVEAQSGGVYEAALAELRAGRKRGHWVWFIFPQHRDLGKSATAKFYGLSGSDEAAAHFAHPVLGPRWRECVAAVEQHCAKGRSVADVLGPLDAMKFRSSLDIFTANSSGAVPADG